MARFPGPRVQGFHGSRYLGIRNSSTQYISLSRGWPGVVLIHHIQLKIFNVSQIERMTLTRYIGNACGLMISPIIRVSETGLNSRFAALEDVNIAPFNENLGSKNILIVPPLELKIELMKSVNFTIVNNQHFKNIELHWLITCKKFDLFLAAISPLWHG